MPKQYGYIRVSTQEQNTIRQEELMTALGVEQIYIDRLSGKNANRPELQNMMDFVRKGDAHIEAFAVPQSRLPGFREFKDVCRRTGNGQKLFDGGFPQTFGFVQSNAIKCLHIIFLFMVKNFVIFAL